MGLYLATGKHAEKGDIVLVDVPAKPTFAMARERGYLNVAWSPVGRIMKRLAGIYGDRVTINSSGVEVNGIRLKNSVPLPCDASARPLQACLLKDKILGPGEVLLMSDYSPKSFDSRYFGPVPASAIESVVRPLWIW